MAIITRGGRTSWGSTDRRARPLEVSARPAQDQGRTSTFDASGSCGCATRRVSHSTTAAELGSRTAGRLVLADRQTEGAGVSPSGPVAEGMRTDAQTETLNGTAGLVGPLPTGRDLDEHGHGEGVARQGEQLDRRRHRLQVDYLGPAGNDHQVGRPGASSAAVSDRGGVSRTTVATRRARAASRVGRSRAGATSVTTGNAASRRSRQRQAEACGSRSRTTAPISTASDVASDVFPAPPFVEAAR